MLDATTKKKIATLLKIKEADFETALKDEKEVPVTIDENLQVFTKEEIETRDTNQKKLGEDAGKEIGMKAVKKAAGLPEDAPSKDPAKLAQAIIDKGVADAKVEPNKKVTELTEQISLLQKQVGEKDKELETSKSQASQAAIDRKILAVFPKERNSTLTDDEYITLLKSVYTFKEDNGNITVEKDGQVLRDSKTTNPLNLSEAVKTIFTDRKWIAEEGGGTGGRGGKDKSDPRTGKYTKLSELKEDFQKQGKNMLGEEFSNAVKKAQTDNKDFDLNS